MKKKKKAFTLVELLSVIVILAIIAGIAFASYTNITKSQKEKAYQVQVDMIIQKAKDWALKNTDKIPENKGIFFLELNTLISEGYIDNTSIVDPRNGTQMSGCITITYNFNTTQYEYAYSDLTCSDLKNNYKPLFTYENKTTDVEVYSTFTLPTKVQATSVTGKVYNLNAPIITKNNKQIDIVDTSTVGDKYSITYSVYDEELSTTYSDTYEVTIVDTIGPVITINHSSGASTSSSDYTKDHHVYIVQGNSYVLPDATVKDNSCGINMDNTAVNNCKTTLTYTRTGSVNTNNQGVYEIKYSATDSSNNNTTLTMKVVITPLEFTCSSGACSYTIIVDGTYRLEGYGAQGGNNGGKGGYIAGSVALKAGDVIKFTIGGTNGYNGGGAAGSSGSIGGGATTIEKNSVTVLTAGGGGATGSTVGGAGGNGTGAGASKPANCGSAAGSGINGGGGGSTGSCTYNTTYPCTQYQPCTKYESVFSSNSGSNCSACLAAFSSPNYCDGWDHPESEAGGKGVWCNGYTDKPYSSTCPYTGTCGTTGTSSGAGGSGGASSLGTNVTQIERQNGNRSSNGLAKMSYISE